MVLVYREKTRSQQWFSSNGGLLPHSPRGHLAVSGDISGYHAEAHATGTHGVGMKEAAKDPAAHKIALHNRELCNSNCQYCQG